MIKVSMLSKRGQKINRFCPTFQVRWSLQSESRLHLQGELVHLPGQHWENHRRQLWRKRKWFPRRRVNARNLQTSGNLWGGRSDNGGQVRRARSSLEKVNASPAQTNSSPVSSEKLDKTGFDLFFWGWNTDGRTGIVMSDEYDQRLLSCLRSFKWLPLTEIIVFLYFRKFIEMGFIDKDRVAIWGWVSRRTSTFRPKIP